MIHELLKKLAVILKPASEANGRTKVNEPVEALRINYQNVSRLAEQIQSHAQRAPYPHVSVRLRQLATEKRRGASLLKEKIKSLGGALEEPPLDLKSAKNHWERMARDLEDQKALETTILEHSVLLAETAPEISTLLRTMLAEQAAHKETLMDLMSRADPQADQS